MAGLRDILDTMRLNPRRSSTLGLMVLLVLAVALLATSAAFAQDRPSTTIQTPTLKRPGEDAPMLLQADEMIYDNRNNVVVAKGHVEIYYGNYTLLADQVIYDRNANQMTAEGNVRIKEPDGAVITADRITLTDDFRDGFIRSLKIVTADDARIAAARATRQEGETTIFERGVFTPCKPCETNPEAPPTWRIKSSRIIHKKTEATIAYENATFEFRGVPIAWVPYFQHADPSVKRKSGFLMPHIQHSNELGWAVETPYYFALAPTYDFTFSPVFTEKKGVLLKGKWRQRTANGRYFIDAAGIWETDQAFISSTDDEFRGSIKTAGDFDINRYWRYGWDITADTDDTFRRYYQLDNILRTDRISQVYLTGLGDRSYFDMRGYHFGGLLKNDTSTADYMVHPVVDYNYIAPRPVIGGEFSFNTNMVSLTRDDGADTHHLISEFGWRRTLIDRIGQVFTPFFGARGDAYQISNVVDPISGFTPDADNVTRGMAHAGAEYRYPFVKHFASASHVFEPIAQIIARPSVGDQRKIPNEDARSLVFDDTLLFDIDKFSGYDRLEGGTRANVGVRYTLQTYNGGYMRAVFGQSYHLAGDNEFPADSGLQTDTSDYVAGLYLQPFTNLAFIAQSRFDQDSFDLKRTDLTTTARYGPFATSVSYANIDPQPGLGFTKARQEILTSGSVLLTQNWSLFGHIRYDIETQERITDAIGLKWADDCFAVSIAYEETFIEDRDIKPDERVMLRFELKYLGAFEVDADPVVSASSGSGGG